MNKEDLRIVFMGTPDFAVPSLKAIIDSGYNVVGVITAPDKKAGRGRKINMSAVKIFALKNYLNILQPANLKDEAFLSELKALNPDLQVVVAFRMLPVSVWSLPPLGTFNLHASLLPQYRGAAPINYAIINGEKETGLTTFLLDDKIDTGRILMQERTEISDNDTAGTLHDRLMIMGSKLIVNTIDRLVKNEITPIDQTYLADDSDIRKAPKISKDDCRINWYNNSITIRNYVRGLSPYPAAMTILKCKNKNFITKILSVQVINDIKQFGDPGEIKTMYNKLYVNSNNGVLEIEEIQLEGKKRMKVAEMLNGFPNIESCRFV